MRAMAVLSGLLLATTCACGDGDDPAAPSAESGAADACQALVVDSLRSPSTAEFVGEPLIEQHSTLEKVFTVVGEVDSQNGFGAQVRSVYECSMFREDDGTFRAHLGDPPKIATR